ncbi:MAG TPA: TIR domain-containing protein [Sphingomicrobium sp.]|nr:TIR domain-containing protein [Sphingomicrobium sp.]
MSDIFISYCREERSAARHFAECFAAEGFSVWWDAVIRSGETFDEVIERELRAAKAVVVLWSPRSVSSRWVRAEATLADRLNKLVPVIIETCNLPIIFELTHAADLADWTGDTSDSRWKTLVSDLSRLIGPPEEQEPVEAPLVTRQPMPVPEPAVPASTRGNGAASRPAQPRQEGLMKSLERLAQSRIPDISKPTPSEIEKTEFFTWSDEYRRNEGEQVHCLRRLDGLDEESIVEITPAGLSVGRTPPSDLIVPGAGVSRAHCLIELAADQLRVTDLNSTNGTYIDNKRVNGSAILEVGSILRVGNVSFEHEVRPRAVTPPTGGLADFDGGNRSPESRVARRS